MKRDHPSLAFVTVEDSTKRGPSGPTSNGIRRSNDHTATDGTSTLLVEDQATNANGSAVNGDMEDQLNGTRADETNSIAVT